MISCKSAFLVTVLTGCIMNIVFARDINLVFGGDVVLGGHYLRIASGWAKDPTWSFHNISGILESADVFMVNCENPITEANRKVEKKFNFKMKPEQTEIFRSSGISLVTIANNHVFDYGKEGLLDTIKNLEEYGIEHVGAGENLDQARSPVVKIIDGRKLFFLAYGNYSPATKNSPGVAYRYPAHVSEDVRRAKTEGADLVIVNFHWGNERDPVPTKNDRFIARLAVDNGADIIVGHHPHIIQPVEIYKNKIIVYSLGNFIFGGNSGGPEEGMLLRVKIGTDNSLSCEKIILLIGPRATKYQPRIKKIIQM